MIEKVCNIWDMYDDGETVCITTNGYVTRGGNAVMGRGVAAQAARRFPTLKAKMGRLIMENGNIVQRVAPRIISFPVKPQLGICREDKSNVVAHMRKQYKPYETVSGWAMMADIHIIGHSLWDLEHFRDRGFFDRVFLPKPGCGAGGLEWKVVKPWCEQCEDWLVVCDLT